MSNKKLAERFDKQANIYVKQRERRLLGKWRERLLRQASGNVLELAVGAGANFPYYSSNVAQVTAVDISPKMIDKAKEAAILHGVQVDVYVLNAEEMDFPENSFDTIVSTLSFCGYDHPIQLLNKLNQWCKPGGKILLMEHGISSNPLLGIIMKMINPIQYKAVGCHLKREMLEIIHESDIDMQQHESYWQGIFHLVWAQPDKQKF